MVTDLPLNLHILSPRWTRLSATGRGQNVGSCRPGSDHSLVGFSLTWALDFELLQFLTSNLSGSWVQFSKLLKSRGFSTPQLPESQTFLCRRCMCTCVCACVCGWG